MIFSLLKIMNETLITWDRPLVLATDMMAFVYAHKILKHLFLLSAIFCIVFGLEAMYEKMQGKFCSHYQSTRLLTIE